MISNEIAETIVKETSLRLNRNVNIMNEKGVIIASKNTARLNQIHEGALEVLRSGESLSIEANERGKWQGAQPGINLPIMFQEQIVGVIGVTGDPEEMADFGGIVKMATELMIKQAFIASQQEWQQRTKEMIIEELLKSAPDFDYINRRLNLIGMKLKPPYHCAMIQFAERSLSNQFILEKTETLLGEGNGIVSFLQFNRLFIIFSGLQEKATEKKAKTIHKELQQLKIDFRISCSTMFTSRQNFIHAFKDCELALDIGNPHENFIHFADLEAKALIYQIDSLGAARFARRVLNDSVTQYTETLEEFFRCNLNIQEAAEKLFIHRNTLIYRVNKVKEKTGLDPRQYKDALTLQMAIWLAERLKWEEEKIGFDL